MITSFRLKNFKSYHDGELPCAPLTVLIGANASGKSNALEGIRLLSWLAQGKRLTDIFHSVQEKDLLLRGTYEDIFFEKEKGLTLGCTLEGLKDWTSIDIVISIEDNSLRIENETIYSPSREILYTVYSRGKGLISDCLVSYNNFSRGGVKPRIPCTSQMAIFRQLETPARFDKRHVKSQKIIPAVTRQFREALESILFLDPNTSLMRGYSFPVEKKLKESGSNISGVLYNLCNNGTKVALLEFIRFLPEQDIRDIEFLVGPRSEVMVQLVETFGATSTPREAAILSDGTLRVLAIAAALFSAPANSTVVVEEIDNGVHPSRAQRLLTNIQKVAKKRKLSVLLTTHNPALLDALPDEAIPDVVCCYRDPNTGESKLVKLDRLQEYPELIAQGPVGKLMTTGILEHYLKYRPSTEERKQKALQWLSALK